MLNRGDHTFSWTIDAVSSASASASASESASASASVATELSVSPTSSLLVEHPKIRVVIRKQKVRMAVLEVDGFSNFRHLKPKKNRVVEINHHGSSRSCR